MSQENVELVRRGAEAVNRRATWEGSRSFPMRIWSSCIGLAYRIREGKLWRMRSYLDPAEALEAAGLSE